MTNQQHPITPSPEQIYLWQNDWKLSSYEPGITETIYVATQAAQWGADQELEACCHQLRLQGFDVVDDLRATRRPKPKSLKQQAIDELVAAYNADQMDDTTFETLGRIIKSLPD